MHMAFAVAHEHRILMYRPYVEVQWDSKQVRGQCVTCVNKEVTESLMRPPWETFRTWACFENRSQWWSKKNDQETLSYPVFLLLANCLLCKWQHGKKGKDRATYSSFSLQFFLTPHKAKSRECWQNVSGSEIKSWIHFVHRFHCSGKNKICIHAHVCTLPKSNCEFQWFHIWINYSYLHRKLVLYNTEVNGKFMLLI